MCHIELGKEGEEKAAQFLRNKGYRIVERNWRQPYGEIDLVALAPDGTLVLVEVKTLHFTGAGLSPENQMTLDKMRKFKRAAEAYANGHPELVCENTGWRCDMVALTKAGEDFLIKHYENV